MICDNWILFLRSPLQKRVPTIPEGFADAADVEQIINPDKVPSTLINATMSDFKSTTLPDSKVQKGQI